MQRFARQIEGLPEQTLRELCSQQMQALARLLPAEELRDLLIGEWMLAGPEAGASVGTGSTHQQARSLTNDQLMGMAAVGRSLTEGSLERWSCKLFFCQLTASAYRHLGTTGAGLDSVSSIAIKPLIHDQMAALPALPSRRRFLRFLARPGDAP
jgi:hypothetical protein